jgi:hypothetical protein
MSLSKIISRIEQQLPDQHPQRILAIANILLAGSQPEETPSPESIRQAVMRLHSLDEQCGAVADELDGVASTRPEEFSPSHIWTLIRVIKVQSQLIELIYPARAVSSDRELSS